ncbi:MAG TPA: hydroxyacid dehydrogenase [Bacillota bacterium]|jgi:D-3-phosphoglycerate dehydrogenase|nr:hydroxyacid dehydrogenase [Bacillota bacterium]
MKVLTKSKPRVLLINPTIHIDGVKILEQEAEIVYAPDGSPKTLKEYLSQGIKGVILRTEVMTKDLIMEASDLRVIGVNGVGYSNVDVDAATAKGVVVVNAVGANKHSVAEHIVMFALAMARDLKRADEAVRSGFWAYRDTYPLHEIRGKTFFSVGFGNIGREACRVMSLAFDMEILVYDPFVEKKEIERYGYRKVERFEDGAKNADFISLHLPHTKETSEMINKETIKAIKPGCKFINCARGQIVDYDALCDALESGQIDMAGIDVFPVEPAPKDHRLFTLDNVLATPHCAGDTVEARRRIAISVANDVLAVLRGEQPRCFVNKDLATKITDLFRK